MWPRKNPQDTPTEPTIISSPEHPPTTHQQISLFLDELEPIEPPTTEKPTQTSKPPIKKKHSFHLKRNLQGKPVYLQDNGKQIATVLDKIQDIKNNLQIYRIQDIETKQIYQLPATHFDQTTDGLIYIPTWYTKGLNLIEHLEFTDRINPELKLLLQDETNSPADLHDLFINNDPELNKYLHQTQTTQQMLTTRLTYLQKERTNIKQHILDLIEQRLIKNIPRKNFADTIQNHRSKATLLDLQINRCQTLITRLNNTSIGFYLYKTQTNTTSHNITHTQTNEHQQLKHKYYTLQQDYHELQEKHAQLKHSIEKLLEKEFL